MKEFILKDIANVKIGFLTGRKKKVNVIKKVKRFSEAIIDEDLKEGNLDQNEIEENLITLKFFNEDTIKPNKEGIKKTIFVEESKHYFTKYYTKENDILVRLREPIEIAYIDKKFINLVIPFTVACIRIKENYKNIVHPKFLAYYLKNPFIKKILASKKIGSFVKMIKKKDLEEIKIRLPDFNKQKKIVELLELIDEKIKFINDLNKDYNDLKIAIFKDYIF